MPGTKHPTKETKSNHIQRAELKSLMHCCYQSGKETHGCFISRRRKHVCLLTTITVPFACISPRDRFSKQPVYGGLFGLLSQQEGCCESWGSRQAETSSQYFDRGGVASSDPTDCWFNNISNSLGVRVPFTEDDLIKSG